MYKQKYDRPTLFRRDYELAYVHASMVCRFEISLIK